MALEVLPLPDGFVGDVIEKRLVPAVEYLSLEAPLFT